MMMMMKMTTTGNTNWDYAPSQNNDAFFILASGFQKWFDGFLRTEAPSVSEVCIGLWSKGNGANGATV